MFLFSDKLLEEEKQLINHINGLKEIFTNILGEQKNLSQEGNSGSFDSSELENYATKSYVEDLFAERDEITSAAFNELNQRILELTQRIQQL